MFPEKLHSIITAAFALFNLPTHPWGSEERKSDKTPKSCFVTHSCGGDQVTEGGSDLKNIHKCKFSWVSSSSPGYRTVSAPDWDNFKGMFYPAIPSALYRFLSLAHLS